MSMGDDRWRRQNGEKIKERYEKARADYQAHQKRERAQHKKLKAQADTERKLVAGEFVLFLLENGEYDRERFMTRLGQVFGRQSSAVIVRLAGA